MSQNKQLLQVQNLKKYFPLTKGLILEKESGYIKAIDDISFNVKKEKHLVLLERQEVVKTTVGRTIIRLYEPTSGEVIYDGVNLVNLKENEMRKMRRRIQMIFQDPYASLDSRLTVEDIDKRTYGDSQSL